MMGHDSEREGEKKEKGIVISQKGSKEQDMMAWPGRQAGRLFWVNLRHSGGLRRRFPTRKWLLPFRDCDHRHEMLHALLPWLSSHLIN
jgi:hypothetical protein